MNAGDEKIGARVYRAWVSFITVSTVSTICWSAAAFELADLFGEG